MEQLMRITFRGMEPSEAVEMRLRDKAAELERLYGQITSCHVVVEAPHRRRQQGNLYSVVVAIHVPGREIVACREHRHHHSHEDVYVAIRDAFEAAARQIEGYAERRYRKVKHHEAPAWGRVVLLSREEGYGFARTPGGTEIYFHENSVVGGAFSQLQIGDEVRVVVAEGEGVDGPQASTILPIGKHHIVEQAVL